MRIHRLVSAASAALLTVLASPAAAQLPAGFDAAWARTAARWRSEAASQGVVGAGIGRESMGLCFFLYDGDGRRLVGHTGTQRAFYSFFIMDPAAKVAAIGAFNAVGVDGAPDTDALRIGTRDRVASQILSLFRSDAR